METKERIYATAEEIGVLFGAPMRRLVMKLAAAGTIRSAKLGSSRQAVRLYRVADVLEWIESHEEPREAAE